MKNQRAYTLIELLIALFIFSIIAVIIAHSLRAVIATRERTMQANTRLEEIQSCFSRLEADFHQLIPYVPHDAGGKSAPLFSWLHETLSFTRGGYLNPGSALPRTSYAAVRYELRGHQLLRFADAIPTKKESTEPQILLSKIKSWAWEFYDNDRNHYRDWPPIQDLSNQIPSAIHLTLELDDFGKLDRLWMTPAQKRTYEIS